MTDTTKQDPHAELMRLHNTLAFVERWSVHHGTKPHMSAEEALSCIQHHPVIRAITKSYADGKVPETQDPYAEIATLTAERDALAAQLEAVGAGGVSSMPANAQHWHDLYRAECRKRQDDAARYDAEILELEATQPQQIAEPAMRACVNGFSQNPGRCDAWCGNDRTCPQQRHIKGSMSQVPAIAKETTK